MSNYISDNEFERYKYWLMEKLGLTIWEPWREFELTHKKGCTYSDYKKWKKSHK